VSLSLAEAGHEVVGLEGDAGMIAEAERQRAAAPEAIRDRVRFVRGDMTRFELGTRFDRVIIPFTGLYCLLDEAALDRCLARVAAHLAPEGVFAFDAYSADVFHAESRPEDYPDDTLELVAEIEHGGAPLRVFERSTWDRERQRVDATYVYRRADGSVRAELEIGHRYVLREQIAPALARAGLSLLGLYGSFDGEPADGESGSIIVLAELASGATEP
jgi:SAM-dependent methyltransferase